MSFFNKIIELAKSIKIVDTYNEKHGFSIVGVSNYQENFKKVLIRNSKYDTPLSKVKEDIYEYNLFETFNNVRLIEEPTNEFDHNAIYLQYKGLKLGYIKKGSTTQVRNLLKKDHIIKIIFYGGNVKGIDFFTNKKIIQKRTLSCRIEIYTKKE